MAREIWKQHLDEAAASLKQRARILLIRSINNGQNNTSPGEDDFQTTFNPWKDLNRCGTSAKIFNSTAQRNKRIKSPRQDFFLFHCVEPIIPTLFEDL